MKFMKAVLGAQGKAVQFLQCGDLCQIKRRVFRKYRSESCRVSVVPEPWVFYRRFHGNEFEVFGGIAKARLWEWPRSKCFQSQPSEKEVGLCSSQKNEGHSIKNEGLHPKWAATNVRWASPLFYLKPPAFLFFLVQPSIPLHPFKPKTLTATAPPPSPVPPSPACNIFSSWFLFFSGIWGRDIALLCLATHCFPIMDKFGVWRSETWGHSFRG